MPGLPGEDGAEVRPFRDADEFDAWLSAHHDHQPGVWLRLAKAGSGIASMTSDEAVDVGLCWGWISGQRRGRRSPGWVRHQPSSRSRTSPIPK